MKLTFLGTGTSTGIPEVGCGCGLCSSSDTRDKRLRTSALVETREGKRILIDCGPDFRQQALRIGLDRVDAILLTHEHYDHIGGIDDLRTIAWQREICIYAQPRVLESLRTRLHYIFSEHPYPGTPRLKLCPIQEGERIEILGTTIVPIRLEHGSLPILGYRIGALSYLTDLKAIAPEQWSIVEGSRVVVLNALRQCKPHPSHQSVEDAMALIATLPTRPELTLLTHLSHHAPSHQELEDNLPCDIRPAHDRLMVELLEGESIKLYPHPTPQPPYEYRDCGRIAYATAWELQKELFEGILTQKQRGESTRSYLLFCEHNPVFTLGKHGEEGNMLMSQEYLQANGYEWFHVERGGDITYHGPGQITGYPILDLETFGLGLKAYIELLEDIVIELLAMYSIVGERKPGASGVWLEASSPQLARKICAIGVRSSRYVTMHGFALNVSTDLTPFSLINPCGFREGRVSSIAQELGDAPDFTVVKRQLSALFHSKLSQLKGKSL